MPKVSTKASNFTESVIREMTRHAHKHGAVNLAQGFPDFPCPSALKEAACAAINADVNQYAITWGAKKFRDALVAKTARFTGIEYDPETEVTVTCGSTEAMMSSLLALVDPGDEVVVFEPFYENYGPDAILCGATPKYVTLAPDGPDGEWVFDPEQLRAAFGSKTAAVIINTPQNPTGKVFTRAELGLIAELCIEHDVVAITDEIYEHILFDGAEHISIATLPGMRERTVTISGLSKSYSVTGWRIGYTLASPTLTRAIRKVHDFLTVGAAAPLQEAGAIALSLSDSYYEKLAQTYRKKRDIFVPMLERLGFEVKLPRGAYYVMAGFSSLSREKDVDFGVRLIKEAGVATVPGSSFFSKRGIGDKLIRFCFCKRDETLHEAAERLESWVKNSS